MRYKLGLRTTAIAALTISLNLSGGCGHRGGFFNGPSVYPPLGTLSDPMWQMQEDNAEPSKFVMYQHEWTLNTTRLNTLGEDHLKQIAARINAGQNFAIVIERSDTTARDATEYKYPLHPNAELDMRRREVVVQVLTALGVPDAPQRVVVSRAITRAYHDFEAQRAYSSGFGAGFGGGGFGGGFGGFGGLGGGFGGGGGGGGGFGGGGFF